MVLIVLIGVFLFRRVLAKASEHLIKIHGVGIKLWTIHADELRLASYGHAAGTTHTCAVHHDGVETGLGGYIVFLGGQCHKLHHDSRSDGDALVHLFALNDLLHAHGHQSLLSQGAVVGHDDQFIGDSSQLLAQNNELCCACCQYSDDAVACLLECTRDRQHRCCAHATASTNDSAKGLDGGRFAQWSDKVCHLISWLESHQLGATHAHALYHEGDSTAFCVSIGNCEGHAFAMFVHANHDEVTCATTTRNQRSF